MPESLLDTYTAERRPVAEGVLANTLAQVAIMRPDPQSGAMRELVANLRQLDGVDRFIGEMTSGLCTRYELGSERDEVGRLIGDKPISHGDADVSLYDVMQDGMGVLLDASTAGKASKVVAATTQRIRCVAVDTGLSMLNVPMPALRGLVRRTALTDWRKRSVAGSSQHWMTGLWCAPNSDHFCHGPRLKFRCTGAPAQEWKGWVRHAPQ